MSDVVHLSARRPAVNYTVHLTSHWDGRLEIWVDDVMDDQRSREAVAEALERAAASLRSDAPTERMKR